MREIICNTCGSSMGLLLPGSQCTCCHVCGSQDIQSTFSFSTPVHDEQGDKMITHCKACGNDTYHAEPIIDHKVCKSPVLEAEIRALYWAVTAGAFEHRPFFCSHCGSQETETSWYRMSFRMDEFIVNTDHAVVGVAEKEKAFMHGMKVLPVKYQPERRHGH